ncbi:MAG: hypothetical protein ACYSUI_18635 [Planctomycetota bacterium]
MLSVFRHLSRGLMVGLLVSVPAPAIAQERAAPSEAPSSSALQQRLERLGGLFGPSVRLGPTTEGSTRVSAKASYEFESDGELQSLAVVQNLWEVRDGSLHGSGYGISQIVCRVPLLSDSCTVRGRLRSSSFFELCLIDPLAERFDGTRAVGRLHFGRMERFATTDWMELSSRESSLQRLYGFRFPDRMQEASLVLANRKLKSRLSVDRGSKIMTGLVRRADLSPVVCVLLAGTVNNRVEIDQLHITGSIDLDSERVTVLTGQGQDFWADGREVTLYYRARGHFRRLLLNGEVVAQQEATAGIWWPTDGPLHRTRLRLRYGDVLVFKLSGVDDEGALHAVGVDQATGRVVLATHPLTFAVAWVPPDESFLRTFEPNWTNRPHISAAQDARAVERLRAALGRDFPGWPIVGPFLDDDSTMYLKTQIR